MRLIASLLVLGCVVSPAPGQWIETTIQLPDSLFGLDSICSIQFHSPNQTVYVGGKGRLVSVDAGTHKKLTRTTLPGVVNLMCSSTAGNKLYGAALYRESVWVVNCATNNSVKTVRLNGRVGAMCYAARSNKVYVACPGESLVDVVDCERDSVVARIHLESWPGALCYNRGLDRIHVAKQTSDEIAVIDCTADTVVSTIWVRGVKPIDVCYDSATDCVYTANYTSGTSSVIDCAGDSLVRVVAVGLKPERILAGPEGRMYYGGYNDSVVAAVESQGTHTIPVGRHLSSMSYDPVNSKVYCAMSDSGVLVVDAAGDTVVAWLNAGDDLRFVCYDPVDASTWVVGATRATVGVVDGATSQLSEMLLFRILHPRALCYNPANNRLYCLGQGRSQADGSLIVIDGDVHRVLKIMPTGGSADSMVLNPANNKVYLNSAADNTVSILDCESDSIIAVVQTGESPQAMCCSDDGKVYVTTKAGGVAVIDPGGDTVQAFVSTPFDPMALCYDRADNKMYVSFWSGGQVSVIDVGGDTVTASVPVPQYHKTVCWNQNHNKVYVCVPDSGYVVVIDCTGDTVLKRLETQEHVWTAYSDSSCDKVYCADPAFGHLCIIDAANDTLCRDLNFGRLASLFDNGQPAEANRLYCTDFGTGSLIVISGATDSIVRSIQVGVKPTDLAWNSLHSWVYVSDSATSRIVVVSDTMLGVEEEQPQASSAKPQATVVRGVLFLLRGSSTSLLDIAGRPVLDLHPGANDVSKLAPGVYFVRPQSAFSSQYTGASTVTKVVIAR